MEETNDSNISTPNTGGEGGGINKDDPYKAANDYFGVALMQMFENRIAEVEQAVWYAAELNNRAINLIDNNNSTSVKKSLMLVRDYLHIVENSFQAIKMFAPHLTLKEEPSEK